MRRWGRLVRRNIGAAGASAGAATRVHQARMDHYQTPTVSAQACSGAGVPARARIGVRAYHLRVHVRGCSYTGEQIHVHGRAFQYRARRMSGWVLSVPRILLQVLTKSVTVAIALPIQVPGRDRRMP